MRTTQLVRCRNGTNRHIVELKDVTVPDLYKLSEKLRDLLLGKSVTLGPDDVAACLEGFSLCHDLLQHCKRLAKET